MNTCDDAAIFFFTTTILRYHAYAVTCICAFYIGTDAIKSLFLGGKFSPWNSAIEWMDFIPKSLLQKKILIQIWMTMALNGNQFNLELRWVSLKTFRWFVLLPDILIMGMTKSNFKDSPLGLYFLYISINKTALSTFKVRGFRRSYFYIRKDMLLPTSL